MRSRVLFFALMLAVGSLALPAAAHASIPFFGPIIPTNNNVCPLGWGALITVINNVIEFLLTIAIVFVAPITIAYGGFLLVTGQGSPGAVTKAKGIITNTIIGIIIALAAWMIVDAVMATLYHPSDSTWGAWSSLIGSGGQPFCLIQAGSLPTDTLNQATFTGIDANGNISVVSPGVANMSAAQIQSAANGANQYRTQVCAAAAAQGIPTQCNQLLGMLGVESGGNKNVSPSSEGAYGLMQLMPATAAANGVSACVGSSNSAPSAACVAALNDPTTNINAGVANYAKLFNEFGGNQTNATAAFNAGDGRGTTADGKKQAFAPSSDCPGQYAWQCTTNPGGFVQTQNYVANVAAVASKVGG